MTELRGKWWAAVPAGLLGLYSAALVRIEVNGGQSSLRPFVTDLEGEVALYGVNTTLSAGLLLVSGVLWAATILVAPEGKDRRHLRYAVMQALVLIGLAFDDRFLVHERLGGITGLPDPLFLGVVAVGQLWLLWHYRDIAMPTRRAQVTLLGAAIAFALMLGLDAFAGADARLRLAGEEITKVWGAALLALWAWWRLATFSDQLRIGVGAE